MEIRDLRTVRVWVEGEEDLAAGLTKRKSQLEEIVAPFVSADQSGYLIRFKGSERFLTPEWAKVHDAVFALQLLYRVLDAQKSGDIGRAVEAAIAFGSASASASLQAAIGHDPVDSMFTGMRHRSVQSNRRTGKGDLTPEQWRRVVERVEAVLYDCGGNRSAAAKQVRVELQRGEFGAVESVPTFDAIRKKRLE